MVYALRTRVCVCVCVCVRVRVRSGGKEGERGKGRRHVQAYFKEGDSAMVALII